jgi:hypothetical protein
LLLLLLRSLLLLLQPLLLLLLPVQSALSTGSAPGLLSFSCM